MRHLVARLFMAVSSPVWAAHCDPDLKPSDTYKELSAKLKCLDDRISAMEEKSAAPQKIAVAPKSIAGTQIQEGRGIKIELEGCSMLESTISCRTYITSTANDVDLYFTEGVLYDAAGAAFRSASYQGAGETAKAKFQTSRKFVSGVRTRGQLYFDGVQDFDGNVIIALQLNVGYQGVLTFRNVALSSN